MTICCRLQTVWNLFLRMSWYVFYGPHISHWWAPSDMYFVSAIRTMEVQHIMNYKVEGFLLFIHPASS